jgi:hypothetical protein
MMQKLRICSFGVDVLMAGRSIPSFQPHRIPVRFQNMRDDRAPRSAHALQHRHLRPLT